MTQIQIRARKRGSVHVEVAVLTHDKAADRFVLCGNATMTRLAFDVFKYAIETGAKELTSDRVEVVETKETE